MDEQRIIAQNIAAIEELDPELYPELTRIFRKTSPSASCVDVHAEPPFSMDTRS